MTSDRRRRRARAAAGTRAFTLVELLVVIGIVALLIGILLPTLTRVREQALFTKCKGNMRGQLQALVLYANDHRDAKPPLMRPKLGTPQLDFVSPDIKWFGTPVGMGLLVAGKYLSLDLLLDPSGSMTEDVERDRANWQSTTLARSGSSYAYFWRSVVPTHGITLASCRKKGETALVMDLNAEDGHAYAGEYAGRPWVSHPRVGRVNVGYVDGSVRDAPAKDLILRHPAGTFEELKWFDAAHRLDVPK